MWERVYHILLKEFLQVLRDPRMKAVIFVTPIIQLLVFGYAVTTDVKNIATAVYDLDRTPQSRELLSRFFASAYFRPQEYVLQVTRIRELMDRTKVSAAIQINAGFAAKLAAHEKAAIQMIVDGTDSNTATVVMSYAAKIIKNYNEDLAVEAIGLPQGASLRKGIDLKNRAWFNINLESRMFYVPGVIALIGMLITLMLTSMAVVREREIGTLEQLMVTPMRPVELILGKTLPFALIGFFDVALITAVAVFWFKVPIEGSLLLLFFATGSLSHVHSWNRPFHLNHFIDTAAGHDVNVFLLFPGCPLIGIHVSYRQHAGRRSVDYLCESAPLFPCDHPGPFSERHRGRDSLAADVSPWDSRDDRLDLELSQVFKKA